MSNRRSDSTKNSRPLAQTCQQTAHDPTELLAGRHSLLLPLEPRLVFDGAVAATAAEVVADIQADVGVTPDAVADAAADAQAEAPVEAPAVDAAQGEQQADDTQAAQDQAGDTAQAESGSPEAVVAALIQASTDISEDDATAGDDTGDTGSDLEAAPLEALSSPDQPALVVIDARVEGYEDLLAGLAPGTQAIVVDADASGVDAISQALDALGTAESLTIITHGEPGEIWLGTDTINSQALGNGLGESVSSWADNFTPEADIFLYGCDVAQGDSGQSFINALAVLTGADVAASTDAVGGQVLGLDWSLEAATGAVAAQSVLSQEAMDAYAGSLAAPDPTFTREISTDLTTNEDVVVTIQDTSNNPITVNDTSDPQDEVTVTITAADGDVTVTTGTGATIGGNGSGNVTITGTIAQVNASLNGMTFLGDPDYSGNTTVNLSVDDGDALGSADTTTVNIKVVQINDMPVLTPPASGFCAYVYENEGTVDFTLHQGAVRFSLADFGLSDPDVDAGDQQTAQIILHIESLPQYGDIKLNGNRLEVGSIFSMADLIAGNLTYTHDGSDSVAVANLDQFNVHVDDGAGGITGAETVNIDIRHVNDAPSVTANNSVYEGETNASLSLSVTDIDQAVGVNHTITITDLPTYGTLYLSGAPVVVGVNNVLTTADLGNLTYTHDGNDLNNGYPPNDLFKVTITDDGGGTGVPMTTAKLDVDLNITPNNDDPVLATNAGDNPGDIVFDPAGAGTNVLNITTGMLEVTDPDTPTGNRTYTLTSVPDRTEGYFRLNGATVLSVGSTFTQADIDGGALDYVFQTDVNGMYLHTFNFTVKDGEITAWPYVESSGSREGGIYDTAAVDSPLTVLDFNITVDNLAGNIHSPGGDPGAGPGASEMPTIDTSGLTLLMENVLEDGNETTTNAVLQILDGDNSASELVFRLVLLPDNGFMFLDTNLDGDYDAGTDTRLSRYDSFTQDDINNGRVAFEHDGGEDFSSFFEVTVSDGTNTQVWDTVNSRAISEIRVNIAVEPINDAPTASVNDTPFLGEGQTEMMGSGVYSQADVDGTGDTTTDNDFDELHNDGAYATAFKTEVMDLPDYGILFIDENGNDAYDAGTDTLLNVGDIFYYSEITGSNLGYEHDGSENFADSFQLRALDRHGATSATRTVDIEIAPFNDDPSHFSQLDMVMDEGDTDTIEGATGYAEANGVGTPTAPGGGTYHLIYEDPDSTYVQRQYLITTATHTGTLYLSGKALGVGSVFTQDDLDNSRVTYTHNGSEDHADHFLFTVRDGGGGSVDGRYDITINPQNDAPEVTVPNNAVEAGTQVTAITGISVDDQDYTEPDGQYVDWMQVTLDTSGVGTLAMSTTTGLDFAFGDANGTGDSDGTDGTLVFRGTRADINNALATLTWDDEGADLDATVLLDITLNDLANGGEALLPGINGQGGPLTDTGQVTIWASSTNNDNELAITSPGAVSATEDIQYNFAGSISIADTDAFGTTDNIVTLKVLHGDLAMSTTTGLTFIDSDGSDGTLSFTGSLTRINNALATLSYTGDTDYNNDQGAEPDDVLTITYDDNDNVGAVQAGVGTDSATVNIEVAAV